MVDYNNLINTAYSTYAGKGPDKIDQEGFDYWNNQLTSGALTPENFNNTFQTSVKDYNKNLVNNTYATLENRQPDKAGSDYWNTQLNTPGSGVTADNFADTFKTASDAFKNNTNKLVTSAYSQLGRSGFGTDSDQIDQEGFDYWSNKLNSGEITPEEFNQQFNSATKGWGKDNKGNWVRVDPSKLTLSDVSPYITPYYQTVEGRMQGLLSSGSEYMQNARKSGEMVADSRGLLNSGLAGQYGQKAAIEAALPIAQQDSKAFTDSAMLGYKANLDANTIREQEMASSRLSAQTADQTALLNEKQQEATSELSNQEASQRLILDRQQQEALTFRNQVQNEFDLTLKNAQISADSKANLAQQFTSLSDRLQALVNSTLVDPNLDPDTKNGVIERAKVEYRANADSLADIYGIDIIWPVAA